MTTFITPVIGLTEGASVGLGFREQEPVTPPAVGTAWTVKLAGQYDHRLLSIKASITTSAVVATRVPVLSLITEDGVTVWSIRTQMTVAASTTADLGFILNYPVNETVELTHAQAPLPDFLLTGGLTLSLSADLLDVGDQITPVSLYWEKYPHGPNGYPTGIQRLTFSSQATP